MTFLEKAARKKLSLPFKPFNTPQDANTIAGFLIERDPADLDKWWVAPQIQMKWSGNSRENEKAVVDAINQIEARRRAGVAAN